VSGSPPLGVKPVTSSADRLARALATTLLAGVWTERAMIARIRPVLVLDPASICRQLVRSVMRSLADDVPPSPARLARALRAAPEFEAITKTATVPTQPTLRTAQFSPAPHFVPLDVPSLVTEGDVASWLGLSVSHLEWLADLRRNHRVAASAPLQHYRYCYLDKRRAKPRLLEAPNPVLKAIQRRILREILDAVPPPACAWFRPRPFGGHRRPAPCG
jgi:hypothetical protein